MGPNPDEPDDKPLAEIMRGIDAKVEPDDQNQARPGTWGRGHREALKRKASERLPRRRLPPGVGQVAREDHEPGGRRAAARAGVLQRQGVRGARVGRRRAGARVQGGVSQLSARGWRSRGRGSRSARARAIDAPEGSSAILLAAAGAAENAARPFAVPAPPAGAIAAPQARSRPRHRRQGGSRQGERDVRGAHQVAKRRQPQVPRPIQIPSGGPARVRQRRAPGWLLRQPVRARGRPPGQRHLQRPGRVHHRQGRQGGEQGDGVDAPLRPRSHPDHRERQARRRRRGTLRLRRVGAPVQRGGGAPSNAAAAVPDAASEAAHAASHGGLAAAAAATVPEGCELYAAFLLDKPGIHRFLGVFDQAADASVAIKQTVPEWKRKNEEREVKNGSVKKARRAGGAGSLAGASAGEELLLRPGGSVAENLSAPPGANARAQNAAIHASLASEVAGA